MNDIDGIEPNFPPLEQAKLFEHLRQQLGISKYIDFIRTINHILEEEEPQRKESKKHSVKARYDSYISRIVKIHYSKAEMELRNDGKTILEALKGTNLHSSFLQAEIKKYLEDAHVQGSYFDSQNLGDDSVPSKFQEMSSADREVLNHRYILPNALMHRGKQGRQSREETINIINEGKMQDAEDLLHDVEMQLVRNMELQYKLQFILDQASEQERFENNNFNLQRIDVPILINSEYPHDQDSSGKNAYYHSLNQAVLREGQLENQKKLPPVEFSASEYLALLGLYGDHTRRAPTKAMNNEKRKKATAELRKSFNERPNEIAKELLSLLKKRYDSLKKTKEASVRESMSTMENRLLHCINRNSDFIKQSEQPLFLFENLLRDIIYTDSWKEPPKGSCFLTKGDDVSTQLSLVDGLFMQIEAARWHKDAFELIQVGISAALRERVAKFLQVVKTFFDLNMQENNCTRAHTGCFMGLVMYGNEWTYAALRLYHVLLVRLHSAYLLAEVDAAEWEFRKHCNDLGKARLEAKNSLAYLSERTKEVMGYKHMMFPPTEGTPDEKLGRFLQAVKKRETQTRSRVYTIQNFENDVVWALGVQGNKLFTVPKILTRIREAIGKMDDIYVELFEKFGMEVSPDTTGAAKQYEDEASSHAREWLFKFQCSYSDSFIEDEWGSVGEFDDVGRLHATIVKKGPLPGENGNGSTKGKRPIRDPHQSKLAKKKKSRLDWSSR